MNFLLIFVFAIFDFCLDFCFVFAIVVVLISELFDRLSKIIFSDFLGFMIQSWL